MVKLGVFRTTHPVYPAIQEDAMARFSTNLEALRYLLRQRNPEH